MTITELPHRGQRYEQSDHGRDRWVPSRAGVLNVWRYYDEVFEFHNGRLLLRGPNGTGKSKALELLLPYLFDASLRPHRLSTFGTGERTMWWNLMGEGATGTTRVGYVWLEFARETESGPEWFTCGARLQASKHTKTPTSNYFTTSRRVGDGDLRLVNESGAPLTKAALEEVLGEYGTLHASGTDYRAEVRHTLFPELTEQRYDALITALLQLRQPKLSERLDPALLSSLLSKALPPLGQAEISELAEGFERLDRQREQLRELDAEVEAARAVAGRQASYAQRVLLAGAGALTSATSELQKHSEAARDSEQEYQKAVQDNAEAEQRKESLDQLVDSLDARIEGLQERDEYKRGQRLDQLRQEAGRATQSAEQAREQATEKQRIAEQDARQADDAGNAEHAAVAATTAARDDAARAAQRADLDSAHDELGTALETGRQARSMLHAAVRGKGERIAAVRSAIEKHETARTRRSEAEEELETARARLAEATTERAARAEGYEAALEQQAEELRSWANSTMELDFEDIEAVAACAESESALQEIVEAASQAMTRTIAEQQAAVTTQRDSAQRERDDLGEQLDSLRRQTDLPPQPPQTRTADRERLDGAPLWKLVSFADGIAESDQAGVEAALQASGLLDAFVPATGAVDIVEHDTFLDPESLAPASGSSLADVLIAEAAAEVSADRVRRLLAGIGYGASPPATRVGVGADGRWQLAGAYGSWAKPEVEHIGAAARERARQRKISECLGRIEECETTIAALDERLRRLSERRAQLDAELTARPRYTGVHEARRALERAEAQVGAADDAVRERSERVSERERAVGESLRNLTALAAEHGLPAEREKLDALDEAVRNFSELALTWVERHGELLTARKHRETMRAYAERSATDATERAEAAETAEAAARDLASKLEAVESTVGAEYREVIAEITSCRQERTEAKSSASAEANTMGQLQKRIGSLETQRSHDAERRDAAITVRDDATARFRYLATGSLPADAGIELNLSTTDGMRATQEAARVVTARWPNIAHAEHNIGDALRRLTEAVHESRDSLSRRAELLLEPDENVHLLTASMDGVRLCASELVTTLEAEVQRSRGDITERERELFDQTLTGDTRRHLADRIRQAGELVDEMNTRLQRVQTASKVTVRLMWQVDPDLPAGTKAARELLLKDPVRLSDEDRESLHQFFRERIEQARADNAAASWEQQLAQVFDYTAWHQFVVKIDRANESGWQLLTKRLHGALSGGEKAIALHLPLFAAVAAHYQSVPTAPRLILLDEVFVGVDSNNRGQVFELLCSLDLDLMLTSDHESGMYSELDGIAIHQLITDGEDDAVTTARFVWDGTEMTSDGPDGP